MSDSSNKAKAFDFAQDATKQLIALSTGTIAITITFLRDLAAHASSDAIRSVEVAWLAHGFSILFGICTMLQLAGHLDKSEEPTIYGGGITIMSLLQIVAFLVGVGFTVAFGFQSHHIQVTGS